MSISSERFRRVLGHLAGGVVVVTSRDGDGVPCGMTATAVCSVSLTPPLVLACLEIERNTHRAIQVSGIFAINVLAGEQEVLARRFAETGETKFDGAEATPGVTGAPLLARTLAYCECAVVQAVPAGDHTIFVGQVRAASAASEEPARAPLVHFRGAYGTLAGGPDPGASSVRP
ncbi:MAG: flavin reductase family protein [Gemmatimonadota bacterium]